MKKKTLERINELREFHNARVNDESRRIELINTLHGDYISSSYYVGKANYETLLDEGKLPLETDSGIYHDQLVISFELLEKYTEEQYKELIDILSSLTDYPLLDDELYSRLEREAIIEYLEQDGINDLRDEIYSQQNGGCCIVKELELPDTITAEQVFRLLNDHGVDIGPDCGTRAIYFYVKKAAESILQSWRENLLVDESITSESFFGVDEEVEK